jgi:hypothetical protein
MCVQSYFLNIYFSSKKLSRGPPQGSVKNQFHKKVIRPTENRFKVYKMLLEREWA